MDKKPIRIGLMVCTAQRPEMLVNCLRSMITQQISAHWSVEICVVENDPEPRSRSAVETLAATSPITIHYTQEPQRGIPFARNRTLQEAIERDYDWIALIDDDEIALPGWLSSHMRAVDSYDADISHGLHTKRFEKEPPNWWPPERIPDRPAGEVMTRAATGNVLFSTNLLKPPANIRFNTAFLYGYEDLDFFERAHAKGFKIVWAPDAVVLEDVPASRVTPQRLIAFVKASAAAHVQVGILRKGYGKSALKFGLKGLRRIISGSVLAGLLYLPKTLGVKSVEHAYYMNRLRLSRGMGNLQGVLRTPPNFYGTIDGH